MGNVFRCRLLARERDQHRVISNRDIREKGNSRCLVVFLIEFANLTLVVVSEGSCVCLGVSSLSQGHKRRFANHNVHKLGDFIRTNMIRNSSESPQVEESSSVRNGLCYADEEDWSKQNRDICPIPDYKHMFVNISELAWLYRTPWINVTKVDLQKTEKNRQCYQARQERIQDVESSMSRVIKPSSSWLEFCSSALDLYIHNPILLISLAYLSLECVMYMFRR